MLIVSFKNCPKGDMEKIKLIEKSPSLRIETAINSYQRRFATALDFGKLTVEAIEKIREVYPDVIQGSGDNLTRMLVNHLLTPNVEEDISIVHTIADTVTRLQCDWIASSLGQRWEKHQTTIPSKLYPWIFGLLPWGLKVDRKMYQLKKLLLQRSVLPEDPHPPPTKDLSFELLGEFVLIRSSQQCVAYPNVVLSEFVSKSVELGLLFYYLAIQPRSDVIDVCKHVMKFLTLLGNVLLSHGNKGYSVLKSIDGICQGVTILRGDPSHSSFLLDNIRAGLQEEKLWSQTMTQIVSLLMNVPLMDVMNYGGITKILGHPVIETHLGLLKLYQRTHLPIHIDEVSIMNVINMAKLLFLNQYRKVNGRYPPVEFQHGCRLGILTKILRGESISNSKPSDLSHILIQPCLPFDRFERLYPLIKDKATSKGRADVLSVISGDDTYSLTARALLDFVKRRSIFGDWTRYMVNFEANPKSCLDQFVIKLTFKELEQKIEGRLFGASPLEERTRRVAMESNICLAMEKYLPDQAMTLTDIEKRMKLYYLRKSEATHKGVVQFVVAVDAEAWNNYFRSDLVDKFGELFLDKIFGVNFYRSTMRVFNQGLIYNIDQSRTLTWWQGQLGGIEGLAQKVWTWIYCCIARLVIEEIGAEGHLLVNGDDLRMILYVPEERVEAQPNYEDFLLDALKNSFNAYGVRMKRDETVITRDFISFSRQAMIHGVNIPSDWKKIIKCSGMSDTPLPLLSSIIPSIYSNAHSAAGQSYLSTPAYQTACFMVLMYLHLHGWISDLFTKGHISDAVLTLTTPAVIGGLEVILLPTLLIQGESDPLPLCLDWFRYLLTKIPQSRRRILQILSLSPRSTTQDISQLLANPYSLPLNTSESPQGIIKRCIRRFLPEITHNVSLYSLEMFDRKFKKDLISSLMSMIPFDARIASLLYSLTPFALLDSIISKFENSVTVASVFQKRGRRSQLDNYINLTFRSDEQYMKDRCPIARRVTTNAREWLTLLLDRHCPTTISTSLREVLWGVGSLDDVTQPVWFQQIRLYTNTYVVPEVVMNYSEEHFSGLVAPPTPFGELTGLLSKAPFSPFFESITRVNLSERFSLTGRYEPLIESIRKMTDAVAQLEGHGGSLSQWINVMSISLFGEELSRVAPTVTSRISGTLTHRLRTSHFRTTIYMNNLPARSGRCNIDMDSNKLTNRLLKENRKYNYSAIRLGLTWFLTKELEDDIWLQSKSSKFWAYLAPCGKECTCHSPINEDPVEIPSPPESFIGAFLRITQTNPMLRLSEATSHDLLSYQVDFQKRWGHQETIHQKYTATQEEAIEAACIHILMRIRQVDFKSFDGSIRDIELVNQVSGSKLPLADLSCKQVVLIPSDYVFEKSCIHCWLKVYTPKYRKGQTLHMVIDSITPKAFLLSWCSHFFTAKRTYELLSGVNKVADTYGVDPILITYSILTNPESLAISVIDLFSRIIRVLLESYTLSYRRLLFYFPTRPTTVFESEEVTTRVYQTLSGNCPLSIRKSLWRSIDESLFTTHRAFHPDVARLIAIGILTYIVLDRVELQYDQSCLSISNTVLPTVSEVYEISQCRMYYHPYTRAIENLELTIYQQGQIRSALQLILESYRRINLQTLSLCVYRINYETAIQGLMTLQSECQDIDKPKSLLDLKPVRISFAQFPEIRILTPFSPATQDLHTIMVTPSAEQIGALAQQLPILPREQRPVIRISFLYRPLKLSTTALNKYLEIISATLDLQYHRSRTFGAIACGDGSGGVAVSLVRLFPNSIVVFNTLVDDDKNSGARCADAAFLRDDEVLRLKHEHNQAGINDLTDPSCAVYLVSVLNTTPFLLLTCDAESKDIEVSVTDKAIVTTIAILACVYLDLGGSAIIKRYITPTKWNCALFTLFRYCFGDVRYVKPMTSHDTSGEIFLIGTNKQRSVNEDLVRKNIELGLTTINDWTDYSISMKRAHQLRENLLHGLQSLRAFPLSSLPIKIRPWPLAQENEFSEWRVTPKFLTETLAGEGCIMTTIEQFFMSLPQYAVLDYVGDELRAHINALLNRPGGPPIKKVLGLIYNMGAVLALSCYKSGQTVEDIPQELNMNYPATIPDRLRSSINKEFVKGVHHVLRLIGGMVF